MILCPNLAKMVFNLRKRIIRQGKIHLYVNISFSGSIWKKSVFKARALKRFKMLVVLTRLTGKTLWTCIFITNFNTYHEKNQCCKTCNLKEKSNNNIGIIVWRKAVRASLEVDIFHQNPPASSPTGERVRSGGAEKRGEADQYPPPTTDFYALIFKSLPPSPLPPVFLKICLPPP